MPRSKLGGAICHRRIEMEGRAISTIRKYAVSTRQHFLGTLFSALLALALFDPGVATAQEVKQIKLTDDHIQGFIAGTGGYGEALQ